MRFFMPNNFICKTLVGNFMSQCLNYFSHLFISEWILFAFAVATFPIREKSVPLSNPSRRCRFSFENSIEKKPKSLAFFLSRQNYKLWKVRNDDGLRRRRSRRKLFSYLIIFSITDSHKLEQD